MTEYKTYSVEYVEALEDVARAAIAVRDVKPPMYEGVESTSEWWDFGYALDKLQEQNDDT